MSWIATYEGCAAYLEQGCVAIRNRGEPCLCRNRAWRSCFCSCCEIDIAKPNHEASVIDSEGKPLLDIVNIANTQEDCRRLFALYERLGIEKMCVIIGMEATCHYWLSVYAHLTEQGYDVRVINPIQPDAFRKMFIRQTNDSMDTFVIVQVMQFGQYSETTLSYEDIVAMRQLTRLRMALADNCGDCRRRIIALLDQVFPEYAGLFSDTFGVAFKESLLQCTTPEDVLVVFYPQADQSVEQASHGRFGEETAREPRDATAGSFGVGFARMPLHFRYAS